MLGVLSFPRTYRFTCSSFILIRVCLPLESVATLKVSGSPFRHWITLLKFNSTGAKTQKGMGRGHYANKSVLWNMGAKTHTVLRDGSRSSQLGGVEPIQKKFSTTPKKSVRYARTIFPLLKKACFSVQYLACIIV